MKLETSANLSGLASSEVTARAVVMESMGILLFSANEQSMDFPAAPNLFSIWTRDVLKAE